MTDRSMVDLKRGIRIEVSALFVIPGVMDDV
jgi:hypothetical protein